ncbi:MAG TPA: glycosyltransferase family 4 protein [Candidatus Binatia bacterium]|nr:glycosyltransferase family 4 protein [Candidatus Binatia bacterium]
MKPRVLFVSRTRYGLPLDPPLARKWDALDAELDLRVLATGVTGGDRRFHLVPARSPAFYLSLPLHVARELRAFRPVVIVAQSPYEAGAALVGRALARVPARVLLEVHGDWSTATRYYGSPLRRLLEPVSRTAARAAVRRADAVRTVSPFTSSLVRDVGVEPAATFTTYYDASAFTASAPVPVPDAPHALFVGVLERYKNVHALAEAWRNVAGRLPEARLHVVGDGREREVVERLVRDLPSRVRWDRRLSPDGVATALDEAAVLVLPSVSEGLPRVAMEAFARGRAVVGARAGGIPDIVVDGVNGLLVPSGDPDALANTIVHVLSEPRLAQTLGAGALAASSRWRQTPEQFAARMRELVDEVRR